MRRRTKAILVILGILLVIGVGFVVWGETPPRPMDEAFKALESDSSVTVTVGDPLIFTPKNSSPTTGFIIYPGGRVDYRSYAPAAHALAAEGYLVFIIRMPLNLAVLSPNAAQRIVDTYSTVTSWAVGGHSLGGSMAAQYVAGTPQRVKGLVLWASYPASGNDLSKTSLQVTTIHGTHDGLVSLNQIEESLKLLPPGTTRVEIDGGNHAQFGWYGPQQGDKDATIARKEQQQRIIQATIQLLQKIG